MHKLLLGSLTAAAVFAAGAAIAADLPVKAMPVKAPPIVAVPFTWTGCYLGGNGGYAWGRKTFEDTGDFLIDEINGTGEVRVDTHGWIAGGQVGCNYQWTTDWVIGFQGSFDAADIKGRAVDPLVTSLVQVLDVKTDSLFSATARLGYTWDRWLLYLTGGAAWAHDKYEILDITTPQDNGHPSETRFGAVVGVGLEWAFWDNWSAFIEYNHYFFGEKTIEFSCGGCTPPNHVDIDQDIDAVKVGVNYRFWSGAAAVAPVVAKY